MKLKNRKKGGRPHTENALGLGYAGDTYTCVFNFTKLGKFSLELLYPMKNDDHMSFKTVGKWLPVL